MIDPQLTQFSAAQWTTVCPLDRIAINTGVCALVNDRQVAVFRIGDGTEVYAIGNYDPFSKAHVLSRGIVGDRNGIPKVASPVYKHNFNLATGECLDDPSITVPKFAVRVVDGQVQVSDRFVWTDQKPTRS
ncbi:nitrite reductase small subunit NirD [Altericista sp. CCNU0014]|uniref:nitrite reductase small subunit NirD n=1 Tax=Altericista sp. CCNU0014 TaxID=3082949 RepID=UPI00384B5AA5